MSLNDKYIINGSTLSAIGDALREIGIPPKKIQGEINIYYKNYTSPWCSANGYQSFKASDFGLTSQTPVKAKMEITAKNGPDVYMMDASRTNWVTASVGKIFYVKFPVSLRGDSSYNSSQIIAKIYPLDGNGNYIIPTSEDDTSEYSTEVTTSMVPNPNRQILVQDIPSLISVPIDYQGLIYGYITTGSTPGFWQDVRKVCWATFIPLTSGQKVGFCIGETVSDRLRAAFFQGKVYNDFQQYVTQPASSQTQIYTGNVNITGTTELSGDGLLKRFYYTAPSDGELIVVTSFNSTSAYLHVWRA